MTLLSLALAVPVALVVTLPGWWPKACAFALRNPRLVGHALGWLVGTMIIGWLEVRWGGR